MSKGVLAAAATALLLVVGAACGSSSSSSRSSGPTVTAAAAAATAPASKGTIVVAAPECAHCLAMSLLSEKVSGYNVKFEALGTLTDLTASLASGDIAVAQIDYTGLVSFLSKGVPLVAISGEVNGGSDFVLAPKLHIAAGDWPALQALIKKDKAAGHPLVIASQFGSIQDIELRLELPRYGVDPNTDVDFVNVEYQGMAQALNNGSAQAAIPVQPFAEAILLDKYGVHFAYPYDQAAGSLTNVVVVTRSYLDSHPAQVAAIASGMAKLVPYLATTAGRAQWAGVVAKYTDLSSEAISKALDQLTPDLGMPYDQIEAINKAMYEQKLIASPIPAGTLKAAVDYQPLVGATGRSAASLGAASQ